MRILTPVPIYDRIISEDIEIGFGLRSKSTILIQKNLIQIDFCLKTQLIDIHTLTFRSQLVNVTVLDSDSL